MHNRLSILLLAIAGSAGPQPGRAAECPSDIRGGWETVIPTDVLFGVRLSIERDPAGGYLARLGTAGEEERVPVREHKHSLHVASERAELTFEGRLAADGRRVDGFVAYASNLYRVTLEPDGDDRWSGRWNPLAVTTGTVGLDLYLDDDGSGGTGGYFFFRDDRLPSLFGLGADCEGRRIRVREKNLGLTLDGTFDADYSLLDATVSALAGKTEVVWRPMSPERLEADPGASEAPVIATGLQSPVDEAPDEAGDGWTTARPTDRDVEAGPLAELVATVARGELPRTHSVLLSKAGDLVFERYFHGFERQVMHDMRSASKSLSSTLVGIAIDRRMIDSADALVLSFFPEYHQENDRDPRKARIRIQHLLTMSSGLDANDSDPDSVAAEGNYQYQSAQPDWIRLALAAPMIAEPGAHHIYGSANPMILGGILDKVVGDRVEWFAERALFAPLGIDSYRIFMDPTGRPYMGGGMYLRPRDMLKIGQLYLDRGRWRGRQIVSEDWVEASFREYGRLEPLDRNGNAYGYLWWHETYDANGRAVHSIEARGNGGQYIFVIPELAAVAVVTSGNYRGGIAMTRQPQAIFRNYLLPALLQEVAAR